MDTTMNIYAKLMAIQAEMNVPKKKWNKFNSFYFRSAEDILAAAKPICHKYGCALTVSDDIKQIGQRYYIESTATLTDGKEAVTVKASAREEENRKGFDGAQITGSASSYARKYALNGLFGLDDADDPDNHDNRENPIICPVCGKSVDGYTGRSGQNYTPAQTLEKHGMCLECVKANRT